MRIFLLILVSSVIALIVDWYIYRRVISRHNFGWFWKIGYLVYAFVVDTAVVSALIAYRNALDHEAAEMLRLVMWVIGFFFLNYIPKLVYAVISLGDYPVQRRRIKRGNNKVSHIFGYSGTALAFCTALLILYSQTWGRSVVRVETVELEFAALPESFDGMRVVHFSDAHLGTLVHRDRFLNRIVDSINACKPDIVVQSGDLVNSHVRELDEGAMSILGGIESRWGVYSVLGNHDMGIYIHDTLTHSPSESVAELVRREKAMGWNVLRDSTLYIRNGADSISVTGLEYPMEFRWDTHSAEMSADMGEAYAGLPDSVFNLTITHAPQLWNDVLGAGRTDLTLAGHVHSMQIKFGSGKWAWSPARLIYDRWSGLYEEDGKYMYINDGVGYVMFPMRVGTKPEVTLYVLKKKRI